ncbi:MAG: glycoside hydrolase family 88 protein, partial [Hyphomicrobiales bacterium]|nr:glycoside hydrolase family 88 protein [Hyphomicrobiales bacterium]
MDIATLAERVTQFALAHHDPRDCWIKATAISGVLAWDDPDAVRAVENWMRGAIATQRTNGNLNYADAVQAIAAGHVRSFTPTAALPAALGFPLMQFYARNRNPAFLEAARRQYQALRDSPRTSDGGVWARAEGPELWIDFVHLMAPFMALYGKMAGDANAVDEAFRQYRIHVGHLVDPAKKLARHAWCERPDHFPQSTFWSRGNGWLVCASVELLDIAPDHADARFVAKTCGEALEAIARCQDASGFLCHVLDDPRSNLEASGTLMFAYAAARAVALGAASAELLAPAAGAFVAVARTVDAA